MKVKSIFATAAVVFYVGAQAQSMTNSNYPKAVKGTQVDNYFGTQVADVYRDLENDSDATKKWVDEEYAGGRTSNINNEELKLLVEIYLPEIARRKAVK